MRKFTFLSFLFLLSLCSGIFAQNTIGMISLVDTAISPGYNLHYMHNQPNVYLMDNCGRVVHTWTDAANFRPGNTAYLMTNGDLIKTKRDASVSGDPIWAGGGGEFIERRDWDNNLLWSFELEDSLFRLHHDIAVMPNGNILAIVWERISGPDAIAAGRDTSLLDDGELWPEKIIEIQPIGTDSFDIVWEWRSWDHLVQDYDSTKPNFGVVADHPELIDLNFGSTVGSKDWHHMNAIDYNSDLDHIVMSVPTFDEIWIIDHSTTTQQAAGHTGGLTGMGGDLIYRWGNPEAYDRGDSTDKLLGYQHDVHWIDLTLSPGSDPDYGKLMIYNNQIGDDYSSVVIIEPLFDTYNWNYLMAGNTFAPTGYDWEYTTNPPQAMYSTGLSSAQRLENGNTLITEGRSGRTFEITPNEDIVWDYVNPLVQGSPLTQGDTALPNSNLTFRVHRYPLDFGAFTGRTITPGQHLEINPDTSLCEALTIAVDDPIDPAVLRYYPNPAQGQLTLDLSGHNQAWVEIYSLVGTRLWAGEVRNGKTQVDVSTWNAGMYLLRVDGRASGKFIVQR